MEEKKKREWWPYGIAASLFLFIAFILFQIYRMQQVDIGIVSDTYYQEGLEYQQIIDKKSNTKKLNKIPKYSVDKEKKKIIVTFQTESPLDVHGTLLLFRPSDRKSDKKFQIVLNPSSEFIIDAKKLKKGYWKLKVDWEEKGKGFYDEGKVVL